MTTIDVKVTDELGGELEDFRAGVVEIGANAFLVPWQNTPVRLDLPKGHPRKVRVAINGPAMAGGARSLIHTMDIAATDRSLTFVVPVCAPDDLRAAGPDRAAHALSLDEEAKVLAGDAPGPGAETLACRRVHVRVVDRDGAGASGYRGRVFYWDCPSLTVDKDIPAHGVAWDIPGGRSLAVCDIWQVDGTGTKIPGTNLRATFNPGGGADVSLVFAAGATNPAMPTSGVILVDAPQAPIRYGSNADIGKPEHQLPFETNVSFDSGVKYTNWRNRAVFEKLRSYVHDDSEALIAEHDLPSQSQLSLLAFWSDTQVHGREIGLFTVGEMGPFAPYTWVAMHLPMESGQPSLIKEGIRVKKLLVKFQA